MLALLVRVPCGLGVLIESAVHILHRLEKLVGVRCQNVANLSHLSLRARMLWPFYSPRRDQRLRSTATYERPVSPGPET
uniref:Uncharacterized protein n=1 Tax=uncultured marine virus TaxID=186617 RepID=A0A0F7L9M4_9VIRU|nr:hypothetical protein [uncultured marine virus]